MAVPSTNIKFSDIYAEANGSYTSGMLSMLTMSFFSYFAGPNGSNSLPSNNWGISENTGKNRIYGTSYKAGPNFGYKVGDFSGLTYFYDQTNFKIVLNAVNNINPPPPPPPPINNDLSIVLTLFDDGFNYSYAGGSSGILIAGGGNYNADISAALNPIIFRAYWKVEVFTDASFGGGTVTIDINGTNYANSIALAAGPAPNTLDSNTYGTADVASYGGFTGLQFDVTCV